MSDESNSILSGAGSGAMAGAALGGPWGALGGAALGAGLSLFQYNKNKKQIASDAANRPQYQIPDEIKQNLSDAQQQALQGLPEEQKQQYISNLQRGTAQGLSQLGSRKAGLAGVATLNEQQNEGYGNLLSADSQARQQGQQRLMGARQTMADYKDQGFQLNKLNPYYEGIAARNANQGALTKSLGNAGQLGLSALSAMGGSGGSQLNMSSNPYGGGQYGQQGQQGNMYGYNPYNNQQGIAPEWNPNNIG